MSNYTAEFAPFYTDGWENQPSENTPIMGEALDEYDETLVKIEQFLANLDLSNAGKDYALLTEAGYSLNLSVDESYILTIDLLNKAGTVLSSKYVDLPLETMFIDASYADGTITLTLQNGNTLDVDISDIVVGLVPTSRTIAGIDLEDDITAEELKDVLSVPTAVSELENDIGYVYASGDEESTEEIVLQEFLPYPKDENGNKLVGESGQIYTANGDGTYSWLTLVTAEEGAY